MPREYTQDEIALAQDYVNLKNQVAGLQREKLVDQLSQDRQRAVSAGYGGRRLRELEEFKASAGILDYNHAMAAYERAHPPSLESSDFFDSGSDEQSELFQKYLRGEESDNAFTRKSVALALKESRSSGYGY